MTTTQALILAMVAAWLLLRRKRRPRVDATSASTSRRSTSYRLGLTCHWFEFIGPDGYARVDHRPTEQAARQAARQVGGRYVGQYDVDLGGRR